MHSSCINVTVCAHKLWKCVSENVKKKQTVHVPWEEDVECTAKGEMRSKGCKQMMVDSTWYLIEDWSWSQQLKVKHLAISTCDILSHFWMELCFYCLHLLHIKSVLLHLEVAASSNLTALSEPTNPSPPWTCHLRLKREQETTEIINHSSVPEHVITATM